MWEYRFSERWSEISSLRWDAQGWGHCSNRDLKQSSTDCTVMVLVEAPSEIRMQRGCSRQFITSEPLQFLLLDWAMPRSLFIVCSARPRVTEERPVHNTMAAKWRRWTWSERDNSRSNSTRTLVHQCDGISGPNRARLRYIIVEWNLL